MLRRVAIAIVCLAMCAATANAAGRPITLDQLQQMFANIKAKTSWNLDGPLLWGYFFIDSNPKKLQPVADQLASEGYHVVGIGPTRDQHRFVLRVEKVEHHTPETLNQRNQDFYALADEYRLEAYDGMDVGPVKPAQ